RAAAARPGRDLARARTPAQAGRMEEGIGMGAKGFFTDTTLCIGCKACEVACKQWNQLPDDGFQFTGMSYDNTGHLGSSTWRHVGFVERPVPLGAQITGAGSFSWLMMSDVCKHCARAGCLESCPTGAIVRTEFDSVYVQPDVCNGCGYCVSACPFGVIDRREDDGRAWKCTLCYDRLREDMVPASRWGRWSRRGGERRGHRQILVRQRGGAPPPAEEGRSVASLRGLLEGEGAAERVGRLAEGPPPPPPAGPLEAA